MGRGLKKSHNVLIFGIVISVIAVLSLIVIAGCSNTLMDDVLEKIEVDKDDTGGIKILSGPQTPSPSDATPISDATPKLNWEDISGAKAYHLQISITEDFSGIMTIDDNSFSTSQYEVFSPLENGQTYYWRVRVQNTDDFWGDWSTVWQFTINISLNIPAIPNPPSGISIIDSTPQLDWEDVDGTEFYELQIDTTTDFDGIPIPMIADINQSKFTILQTNMLNDNTWYYWRVRCVNPDGIRGEWSEPWMFKVDIVSPSNQLPATGSTVIETSPTYNWDELENAVSYQFQLDTDSLFSGVPLIDQTITGNSIIQPSILLDAGIQYYWRVRTKNDDDIWGDWGTSNEIILFSSSPIYGKSIIDRTPLINWDDITSAVAYEIRGNASEDMNGTVFFDSIYTTDSQYTVSNQFQDNTTCYWQIRAELSGGSWTDWSASREFFVAPVINITSRSYTSFALRSDGTVWAWGNNDLGQIGDNTTITRPTPVQIPGLSDVVQIEAADWHTLARKSDGTVWAWGDNRAGKLGIGSETNKYIPTRITALSNVVDIACGEWHSLALLSDGSIRAWGRGGNGRLGNNLTDDQWSPVSVSVLTSGVSKIACGGKHSMAIDNSGNLYTWGTFDEGQLGTGAIADALVPEQVDLSDDIEMVVGGENHTLAVTDTQAVWAWGENNKSQIGDGTQTNRAEPVKIINSGMTIVGAGENFSFAVLTTGYVSAWGEGYNGRLGTGDNTDRTTPYPVLNLANIIDIDGGNEYGIAVDDDGIVWTWGFNNYGQLGIEGVTVLYEPTQVPWP